MRTSGCLLIAMQCLAQGILVDRIAIVVDKSIIKDSDIDRDIRVTEFLNQEPLRIDPAEKKKAAQKLIDQIFLRAEIRTGRYPYATEEQSDRQLEALVQRRSPTQAAFQKALERYDLDEATLRQQFRWQLTVLAFIDARFRPAVVVREADAEKYYREHAATLRKENSKASVDDLREKARNILIEEEVNRLLFAWLEERRKDAKISFHEGGLA